jgi:AcrR family transcriptional regulator
MVTMAPSSTQQRPQPRHEAVREFKRGLIQDAAKRLFAEKGIGEASVREIASSAGYTTGAIYTYFATKEELYAAVLRDSLRSLHDEVLQAAHAATSEQTVAALRALWGFYDSRPADFDLGFYLYGGARPVGLTPELNRELNDLLDQVMSLIGESMVADGLATAEESHHLAVSSASSVFGLLLMAQTGRLRSLGEDPERLLDTTLSTVTTPTVRAQSTETQPEKGT